jgi:hypothetical protein
MNRATTPNHSKAQSHVGEAAFSHEKARDERAQDACPRAVEKCDNDTPKIYDQKGEKL